VDRGDAQDILSQVAGMGEGVPLITDEIFAGRPVSEKIWKASLITDSSGGIAQVSAGGRVGILM